MPGSRPPYPPEFRRRMVELVRAGRSPEELAEEFEPSAIHATTGSPGAPLQPLKLPGDLPLSTASVVSLVQPHELAS